MPRARRPPARSPALQRCNVAQGPGRHRHSACQGPHARHAHEGGALLRRCGSPRARSTSSCCLQRGCLGRDVWDKFTQTFDLNEQDFFGLQFERVRRALRCAGRRPTVLHRLQTKTSRSPPMRARMTLPSPQPAGSTSAPPSGSRCLARLLPHGITPSVRRAVDQPAESQRACVGVRIPRQVLLRSVRPAHMGRLRPVSVPNQACAAHCPSPRHLVFLQLREDLSLGKCVVWQPARILTGLQVFCCTRRGHRACRPGGTSPVPRLCARGPWAHLSRRRRAHPGPGAHEIIPQVSCPHCYRRLSSWSPSARHTRSMLERPSSTRKTPFSNSPATPSTMALPALA